MGEQIKVPWYERALIVVLRAATKIILKYGMKPNRGIDGTKITEDSNNR